MLSQRILVVDDDEILRSQLSRAFNRRGFLAVEAANYDEAVEQLSDLPIDMAVVDLRMPGKSGIEVLGKNQRAFTKKTRTVMLTGYGSIANAVDAVKHGAINYLSKPVDADQILKALQPDAEIEVEYHTPSLAEAEWNHIQKVLADCGGNVFRSCSNTRHSAQNFATQA